LTQLVLDPADPSVRGSWTPPGPIPKAVRSFGRFPNADQWLPGDLILLSAVQPRLVSRQIIHAQEEGGFAPEHARWHHAAVYVGELRICEATLGGVKAVFLYPYIGSHRIRVRRPPGLTPDERWKLVVNSLFHLGQGYSFETVLALAWQARKGFWNGPKRLHNPLTSRAVICSQLYADAYSITTLRALGNTSGQTPSPASLSHTPLLQDVDVGWYSIGD
jgi:hypothetical protein